MRLDGKWRSSKTTSEPSSSVGSTAPQTVVETSADAPSGGQRRDVARGATWFDRRAWPARGAGRAHRHAPSVP